MNFVQISVCCNIEISVIIKTGSFKFDKKVYVNCTRR